MPKKGQNMGNIIGGHAPKEISLAGREHCIYLLIDFKKEIYKDRPDILQKGQKAFDLETNKPFIKK